MMSVSLVVYRLEVADDSTSYPQYLSYISPKYQQQRVSVDTGTCVSNASKKKEVPKHITDKLSSRGKRQFTALEIITLKDELLDIKLTMKSAGKSVDKNKDEPPEKQGIPKNEKAKCDFDEVEFISGNPNVDITKGILHLYKEANEMTSLKDEVLRSELICLLAVPTKFSLNELLSFTAPVSSNITHLRIIKDTKPTYYMVLVKFKNQEYADEFYKAYNGARFNMLEEDVCHLVYVARVEVSKEGDIGGGSLPIEGLTELPQCNICLERMDESVDGILTILCNHTFHSKCLLQWEDSTCPVCRYYQTPEEVTGANTTCSVESCARREDLWICLICGYVGCGRYTEGHAYSHFQETQHTYSMELHTNRVWDYAGDNYVHRLIQSKGGDGEANGGGKMVQYEPSDQKGADNAAELKMDSITLEYTYLLTSQLEQQRTYFEDMMHRLEQEAKEQREQMEATSKKTIEEYKKLESKYATVCSEKENAERKCVQLQSRVDKLTSELQDERELNKHLQQNQADWQVKVKRLEVAQKVQEEKSKQEIGDLKDQLRDVMFFLEAQNKLQESTLVSKEELEESSLEVSENQAAASSSKGGARRSKGKR